MKELTFFLTLFLAINVFVTTHFLTQYHNETIAKIESLEANQYACVSSQQEAIERGSHYTLSCYINQ
jgi:hypothetical protein